MMRKFRWPGKNMDCLVYSFGIFNHKVILGFRFQISIKISWNFGKTKMIFSLGKKKSQIS